MNILAILVIYNCKITDSKTFNALLLNFKEEPECFRNFKLIIYDNGSEDQSNLSIPFNYSYVQEFENKGLAVAYNYALNEENVIKYDWLLLLDQDSSLPITFINDLSKDLKHVENESTVMAIAPKMCYNNYFFSPSKVLYGGIHRPIDMNRKGVCLFEAFAIGSGSTVRISFLKSIGGFNEFFWLDCLDRWLYMTIYKKGYKLYVTDSVIQHELSVMDYSKFINETRYNNILKYETCFMRFYKSKMENFVYYLRLMRRIISNSLHTESRKYSILTLKHLISIIFCPKKLKYEHGTK